MPSPFPGMDPYIEGQKWREFHQKLADEIQSTLMPGLRPRFVASVEERVCIEHTPEELARPTAPDPAVGAAWPRVRAEGSGDTAAFVPPFIIPMAMPEEIREPYVEIHLRGSGEVVALIEILSPGNKRPGSDGRREYLAKRESVLPTRVHLIELDLLRGGERLPMGRPLPTADYFAFVRRGTARMAAGVWPISLREPLPTIPVPLADDDPDLPLDLQAVFTTVYDQTGYDYSLDYERDTVPPLSEEDAAWARELFAAAPRG